MLVARAIGEVAKRGIQRDPRLFEADREAMIAYMQFDPTLPWWGGPLLWIIYFAFLYMMFSINYSVDHVMGTAAMVESTNPAPAYSPAPRADDDDEKEKERDDPDDPLLFAHDEPTTPYVPLTRHIRTFRRHLRPIGGRASRFRALHYGLVWMLPFGLLITTLETILHFLPMGNFLAVALAAAITAPLHAAWTHATIAMPNQSSFRARHAHTRRGWRALALPAAVWGASAEVLVTSARLVLTTVADMTERGPLAPQKVGLLLAGTGLLMLAYYVLVDARLRVFLVRVEAAMFPIDEAAIVPLDAELADLVACKDNGRFRITCAAWWSMFRPLANGGYQRYLLIVAQVMAFNVSLLLLMVGSLFVVLWACWGDQLIMLLRAGKAAYHLYLEDLAKATTGGAGEGMPK